MIIDGLNQVSPILFVSLVRLLCLRCNLSMLKAL